MTPDEVLQGCLEDLESGALSLDDYVERYAEAASLAGPLRAAQRLRTAPRPTLSAATTQAQEARLRAALQAQRPRQPARRRSAWVWPRLTISQPVLRWAMALVLVAALLMGSTGVVAAAAESLPGELLYPVKRTTETVRVSLTPLAGRAKLHLALARERAEELEAVVVRGLATPLVVKELTTAMLAETELALAHIDAAPAGEQASLLTEALASIEQQQALLETVTEQLTVTTEVELASALATVQLNGTVVEATLAQMPNAPTLTPPAPTAAAVNTRSPDTTTLPTASDTPEATLTATARPSATHTPTSTITLTPTPTDSATTVPSSTPADTHTPTVTPTPSHTALPPTATPAPPTDTPPPTVPPTPTWTPVPTDTPTLTPTETPPPTATACPTNRGGRPKCRP